MASRILCKSMRFATNTVVCQSLIRKMTPTASSVSAIRIAQNKSLFFSTSSQARASSEVSNKLTTFISEEIKLETDSRKHKAPSPKITGFDLKTEGPVVTLTKTHGGDEQIVITFNVNGSLDDEQAFDQQANERNENQSTPEAEVDVLF